MPIRFNPLEHPEIVPNEFYVRTEIGWVKHLPFAHLLVKLARPRLLVELGTHTGVSYCAFCEAVRINRLETKCFAVDTWQGDAHIGAYSPEILKQLRAYHDPKYASFSTLIQSTFDAALSQFADGTIDVLHIDGLHTYEAAKHDFESWKPKLSNTAVVLFHDTAIKTKDFGVYRLWAELEGHYPSFQFLFGNGLGVMAVGPDSPRPVCDFLEDARANLWAVNQVFNILGDRYLLTAGWRFVQSAMLRQNAVLNGWKSKTGRPEYPPADRRNTELSPFEFTDQISRDVEALVAENQALRGRGGGQ